MMRTIQLAETDEQRARCFPVMAHLRPHLKAEEFVGRVRYQEERDGFRLAYVEADDVVVAVAGFRFMEKLTVGRVLYVDDLVTNPDVRSQGNGAALLTWLYERARAEGCQQLELDSGTQRMDAHRFYFRERMHIHSFHFVRKIDNPIV